MTTEQDERYIAAMEKIAKALAGMNDAMVAIATGMHSEPEEERKLRNKINFKRLKKEAEALEKSEGPLENIPGDD